jgi:hypothetical protein
MNFSSPPDTSAGKWGGDAGKWLLDIAEPVGGTILTFVKESLVSVTLKSNSSYPGHSFRRNHYILSPLAYWREIHTFPNQESPCLSQDLLNLENAGQLSFLCF